MNNKEIAARFDLLAKLMELHGENSFKTKAYSTAAYRINKLGNPLSNTNLQSLSIPGIGEAILNKIGTLITTGQLPILEEYLQKTPSGVVDMLYIKGIGPKKVALLWKALAIESIGELAYACQENRLLTLKGFGAKTQAAVLDNIHFLQQNKGHYLYADIEAKAQQLLQTLQNEFPQFKTELTGAFRRQLPVLESIDYLTEIPFSDLKTSLLQQDITLEEVSENDIEIKAKKEEMPRLSFFLANPSLSFASQWFETTGSMGFSNAFRSDNTLPENVETEAEIFQHNHLPFLAPALRESDYFLINARENNIPELIQTNEIKGMIHCHSTYSDGLHSLEEMATAAKEKGFEYMVISDHSQTAVYAQGLKPNRILQQHEEIDKLNDQLAPFRIFKGIESDILSDGNLDYEQEILASFDVVIASVHSNLKMEEEKAMQRLMKAIENPFTTILGHPTGRLLLSRKGYPINHKKIIDACAAHNVVIEINAHPQRLDLDWTWIPYAIEKGALLSIDPDAHSIGGMDLIKYGVLAAQKGGLTAAENLSSKNLNEFLSFLKPVS